MSIFKKITILFLISLSLMIVIGYKMDSINTTRIEALITQKYLQDAKEIFVLLATSNPNQIENKLRTLNLTKVDTSYNKKTELILKQIHSFGKLQILKTTDNKYILFIQYMDDTILLIDYKLQKSFQEQWLLNILVVFDIIVLIAIFLIILKILAPLKELISKMKNFANGNYFGQIEVKSNDEIGNAAATYNMMAQNIQNLITSREEFLRDISHELKTPISKGFFATETLEDSESKTIIQKSFSELERLSAELLEIEKLHAVDEVNQERFKVETLILEALSRLILEDESKISIDIKENFFIDGDLNYLSLALKNLIDNAIKYTTTYPVYITADESKVTVKNKGDKLVNDISYYLEAFTQEENSRSSKGYGLGLNIVKKIIDKHKIKLSYIYKDGSHLFSLDFK
ncbi:ArsS family sensor histidine kinase [Sulfurimonas sp.]|uniref:ArsS family sensor histidine kinase n=1 Tax=Sulfurimonas sp. TaxID=2022749 RepID=UPI003568C03A